MIALRWLVALFTVIPSCLLFALSLDPGAQSGQAMPLGGLFRMAAVSWLAVGAIVFAALFAI